MSTFSVTDASQLIDAVNYALSNLGQSSGNGGGTGNSVTINTQTGVIGEGGYVLSYLYRYITVRYATSAAGDGLTTNPVGATYFGVYNNNSQTPPDDSNPGNYQWTECTAALSGTNLLWYSTLGGRQIQFYVGTQASLPQPASNWAQVDNTTPTNVIDLDFVTATATLPLVVMTAYYNAANANVTPATPTGGTYDFGNLIFTAPSGWTNSIPANNVAFFSSQNQFQSVASGNIIVGPVDPWTIPVLTGKLGQDGANGANGANGTNGSNGVSTYFYNTFLSSNTTPTTPSGGYYNFNTSTGTPPSGWSNTPASIGGAPIWATSAQVSSNVPTANVGPISSWSTPFQYTGAGGAPGQRGFVPMAYVLTPSTPVGASNSNLSNWFQAPTNGTPAGSNTAPVGTGFVPVTGDTAAFTWASNTAVVAVYTYDATTSAWTPADGQVINGNVFVTGSVNAAKLNANDIYALKLQSTNANFGNNTSNGFWFDSFSGNARIAGNVSIGNTLTIGNNANIANNLTIGANANVGTNLTVGANLIIGNNCSIGGNLTVAGLITGNGAGATLNANTVTTTTVVPQSITATDYIQSSLPIGVMDYPVLNTIYYAGTGIIANCSSAGTTVTTAGPFPDLLSYQYFLETGKVTKTSGTGTLASNTTITNVISNTQMTLSAAPTVALSNATLRSVAPMAIYVRALPGLYITTDAPNQIVQFSLNGVIEVDSVCTSLAAGIIGQLQLDIYVIRFPYVPGNTIDNGGGVTVFNQSFGLPQVYFTGVTNIQTQPYTFAGAVDDAATAGTYVYTTAFAIQPINGTFTLNRAEMTGIAGSGTVLKNQ